MNKVMTRSKSTIKSPAPVALEFVPNDFQASLLLIATVMKDEIEQIRDCAELNRSGLTLEDDCGDPAELIANTLKSLVQVEKTVNPTDFSFEDPRRGRWLREPGSYCSRIVLSAASANLIKCYDELLSRFTNVDAICRGQIREMAPEDFYQLCWNYEFPRLNVRVLDRILLNADIVIATLG